jgi:hypothetical protein
MAQIQKWDESHTKSPVINVQKGHQTTLWTLSQSAVEEDHSDCDAVQLAQDLRQGISKNEFSLRCTDPLPPIIGTGSDRVPSQVLLTCHFSLYRERCMNGIDILNPLRMKNLAAVRCISIQGGMDRICPPDTALDLLEAWPSGTTSVTGFELRMPMHAGHSMYDPFLTHEVISATDVIATDFIQENAKHY